MGKKYVPYVAAILVLAALAALVLRQPGREPGSVVRSEFLMDTIVECRVFHDDSQEAEEILDLVFEAMGQLEQILDRHRDYSETNRVNRSAGREPVAVSAELNGVIAKAVTVAEKTGGAFDITIAPLVELWGFGTDRVSVPDEKDIAQALTLVDYGKIRLEDGTVFLESEGMQLDLGGIAKGYIVDRAAKILRENGIDSAYIDAGGDIRVLGGKPDGSAWKVGVRNPRGQDRMALVAVMEIRDRAVVTSGDYERFFTVDGVRYHHILDPKTGQPARGLASVTVLAPDAFTADAYSTACFILGLEKGMQLIESEPDLEAIMVTESGDVFLSGGLEGQVTVIE